MLPWKGKIKKSPIIICFIGNDVIEGIEPQKVEVNISHDLNVNQIINLNFSKADKTEIYEGVEIYGGIDY